ncbi:MAG: esterase family protein [Ignavibacteriales bacterium]|nr:esterase family protein [Ignavibacteriales bacterium]MCF8305869.1 esterase family protein [Ignavibacteriales bacterium]MCF8315591.1 esterase family protein [Ignavibacteriales bacterium]MCF8437216.1 esterase family protein [Ignavibacteriales bacterium]
MKKAFLSIIVLITLINIINAQDRIIFEKQYIPKPDTVLIYSPAKANPEKPLPLLYLLHGYSGDYGHWSRMVDLQTLADKYNIIIVTPDGFFDSWYIDNLHRPDVQYEKHFWTDLEPEVMKRYNVDKANIFITGLSMGGHGAMLFFLKHKDYFRAGGSMSGILDISAFADRWTIKGALGDFASNKESWYKNSAVNLVKNITGTDKQLLIDCGTEDFAYDVNLAFAAECRKNGVKATFISRPGKHDQTFWKRSVIYNLEFFKEIMNTGN